MECELDVLKIRSVVECMKIYEFYDESDIPDKFIEFYNLGKKLIQLENEMRMEMSNGK